MCSWHSVGEDEDAVMGDCISQSPMTNDQVQNASSGKIEGSCMETSVTRSFAQQAQIHMAAIMLSLR